MESDYERAVSYFKNGAVRCRQDYFEAHSLGGLLLAKVEAQAKEIDGLRGALMPFAMEFRLHAVRYEKVKSKWFEQMPDEWPISLKVRMSDGRRAEAALRGEDK